ncbi:MAG: histidine kinase, partial [Anaerolineae bacterium]|nr:histidine kinase [Anaerolineae bacterium]
LICALYPPLQSQLWVSYTFQKVEPTYMLLKVTEHGIWFWVYAFQAYLLIFAGAILIIIYYFQSSRVYRQQSLWVVIGAFLPLLTNFLYLSKIIPGLTKDFSPIGYSIAGICFTIGITRYQLLDLMPVARATLVDKMNEGVIVLDAFERVVDINPAARWMLNVSDDIEVGCAVSQLFSPWKVWQQIFTALESPPGTVAINQEKNGQIFWYDLHISPLNKNRNETTGKLLIISDVTERNRAEMALRRAHDELELRVKERTAELAALNATLEQRVTARTRELSILYQVSNIAGQAPNLNNLLSQTLEQTMQAIPCDRGAIYLTENNDDENLPVNFKLAFQKGIPQKVLEQIEFIPGNHQILNEVLQQNEPSIIKPVGVDFLEEQQNNAGNNLLVIAPMQIKGRLLGLIILLNNSAIPFEPEDIHLLASICGQVALAVQSNQLRQQAIVYEERQRLSRDLHDSVTQSLYGLVTLSEAAQAVLENGSTQNLAHMLERIGQTARQALKEIRLYIYELRPPVLENVGLAGAIQLRLTAVEGRSNVSTRLIAGDGLKMTPPVMNALYHICQEALNNILKHTRATEITVYLQQQNENLVLEVADNGCGFDPLQKNNQGMGLNNMRERAEKVGGFFELISQIGHGTRVRVCIPLRTRYAEVQS